MSSSHQALAPDANLSDAEQLTEARAAVADLSVPALVATAVQISQDPALVRGSIRPREFIMNEFQGAMTEEEKASLRQQALAVIEAWIGKGCPEVKPLSEPMIREIMDWIACEPVADEYAALYMEEMSMLGEDLRRIDLPSANDRKPEDLSAIIIGCGESGILAGLRLKQAGVQFSIFEKSDGVGGVWYDNRYPGCRVDVASHYYSYSFGPQNLFSEYYAQQPEIEAYFKQVFDEYQLAEHVQWQSEVERAEWLEGRGQWQVTLRKSDGSEEVHYSDLLISGVGILNRPLIPNIPGMDQFDGPVLHSARWDTELELKGKRVALIGAGASGFQIGPAIIDEVEQLTVFQRTPQWMSPNPRYHDAIKPGEAWAFNHLPYYDKWYRFMLMWQSSDKLLEMVRVQEDWPDFPRTCNAYSAQRREVFVNWIEKSVGDDPDLAAKVTPDYPPMAKRMLQDNGSWMRCLIQPHSQLITDKIDRIDAGGIYTADGYFECDVIILATGFEANEVLVPMEIVGRSGQSLEQTWDGKPTALYGVSVPDFPNFFILGGPGIGLAHAGSVILVNECQMRYVGDAINKLLAGNHRTIEPTVAAYQDYTKALLDEVETLMWGHPSIEHTWYKAKDGKVYLLCPWRLVDYWQMTAEAKLEEHKFC